MLVLGLDPGLADMGWGLVEQQGSRLIHVAHGSVRTASGQSLEQRLLLLHDAVARLIAEHRPALVSVEELFFARNASSAIPVAQARGVMLLAAAQAGLRVAEYTPNQIKQAVLGIGKAEKSQVQAMVKLLLGLGAIPKPDHAADALAAAICHLHSRGGFVHV